MKRVLSAMISLVMALTVFAAVPDMGGTAFASTTLKAKTTAAVNIRSKASASSTKLGTYEKGKTFTVKGAVKDSEGVYWYKLSYNSKAAYLSSKYAVRTGLSTTTITKTTGTVTANDINVRLGPGTDYDVVVRASKGYKFNVNGEANDSNGKKWYRVYDTDGFKLYISSTYLKLAGESSSTAASSSTTLTMKGKTTDSVNVRSKAAKTGTIKGVLEKGKTVTIYALKKNSETSTYWYQIKYGSGKGYVSATYVSRTGYTTESIKNTKGTIKGSSVNLRLGPGTTYPVYKTAENGKTYTVTGKSTDSSGYVWYRLKINSKLVLYAGSDYVTITSEDEDSDESSGNVKAEDVTYPETLAKGASFSLKGTLESSYTITKTVTGITDSSGSWLDGYKVVSEPGSTSYDIAEKVDSEIKFGNLDCGTYHYRCEATTSEGKETVFDYEFTVKEMATITLSNVTYPEVHKQYKSFSIKGTVKSSETITRLVVGVAKSNGKWLSGHYVVANPNSKSYDLSKADSSIKFGDISTGSFIYRCYVTTATGKQLAFSYSFTVNKNTGIPSAISYGTLSGDQCKDIVKIAKAQAGYSTNKENHTVYNLWYYGSDTSAAWCAIFVSWCANQAGVSTGVIPKMAYVPSITSWYKNKNKSRFNAKKTLPKKGDLIIYAGSCHIGIVAKDVTSTSGKVSTIEGNTGNDEVKYRENYMKWNSSAIQGYCRPNYK